MLLNSWGIALTLLSVTVVIFILIASRTAWRVIRRWNPGNDSNQQISLENEIWLSSTLIEYTLVIQCLSLVLFVLAADAFCQVIVGAMCATGTLMANPYGIPALYIKLAGIFIYGLWIVIHRLDISAETYPLVRIKFYYFSFIVLFVSIDLTLQTLYLINLSPEIITSCCGVVFEASNGNDGNLLESIQTNFFLYLFYGLASLIVINGIILLKYQQKILSLLYSCSWILFFFLSLVGITTTFSSYIYAMPYHHCPFCIIKPEYSYYGFLLYGSLIPGTLFALAVSLIKFFDCFSELQHSISRRQVLYIKLSLALLSLFVIFSSFHLLSYHFLGGEV